MPFLKDKSKLVSRSKRLQDSTNKNGLRHSIFNVFDDKYIGDWGNNLKEGKGSLLTTSCRLYKGDWSNNCRHGFGVLSFQLSKNIFILQYRGDWIKGKKCGFGAFYYLDGGYFIGYWDNGKRRGYGQMWYPNGAFYDGDWVNDKRHGKGMLVRSDGNRYEGSWLSDLKHGKGRFFHLNTGQMQEGVWHNDVCIYSFIIDIPFKQSALHPTPYPIVKNTLLNREDIFKNRETESLSVDTISKTSTH